MNIKELLAAAFAGALFAVGLGVSGMTLPSKVQGFLDLFGDWDPSLAFVMGGAVVVYTIGYRLIVKKPKPLFTKTFSLPTRRDITPRLVVGSAMFGIGWGLAGLCPGPAVVATTTATLEVVAFVGAMLAGFFLHDLLDARSSATESGSLPAEAGAE